VSPLSIWGGAGVAGGAAGAGAAPGDGVPAEGVAAAGGVAGASTFAPSPLPAGGAPSWANTSGAARPSKINRQTNTGQLLRREITSLTSRFTASNPLFGNILEWFEQPVCHFPG
jgi:hypothetical protein